MAATMTETMHRGLHAQDPDGVAHEIGMLLRGPSRARFENLLSRDVPQRSGSAPPSVEGSLAGVASLSSLFHNQNGGPEGLTARDKAGIAAAYAEDYNIPENEKELRSDPAYLAYYYSHINLNPRLPPPLISWENWRLAQRLQAGLKVGGGFAERGRGSEENGALSKSLFATQPVLPTHREEEPEQLASDNEGSDSGNAAGREGNDCCNMHFQRVFFSLECCGRAVRFCLISVECCILC
jgi:pumilio RNA-binding family